MTSGGRGVGFDVACMLEDAWWPSSFLPFLSATHLSVHLSLLLRQQRAVDVAASLKPTVAASSERFRANFEVGDGLSGTRFFASDESADNWLCIS